MLKFVEGDILLSKADAIAHGVAPNDDFHSGLALSLHEQWPSLYKDFRHYCRLSHPQAGNVWSWRGTSGQTIYNLMTQEAAYGQGAKPGKASLENVRHSLIALAEECTRAGHKSLAISRLATGVGGLDWAAVQPLVEQYLGSLPTNVFVYKTFKKGVAAEAH